MGDQFTTTKSVQFASPVKVQPTREDGLERGEAIHHQEHERQQLSASHGAKVQNPPTIDRPPAQQ